MSNNNVPPRSAVDDATVRQQQERISKLAREAMPDLPKRFYSDVTTAVADDAPESNPSFRVLLDGRAMRTPAKNIFEVPSQAMAEAIAAEWRAQGDVIDPRTMPLTRLSNVVIDGVIGNPQPLRDEIVKYGLNDLVCYRAEAPLGLIEVQQRHWDPVVDWAATIFYARPLVATGIMPVTQPEQIGTGLAKWAGDRDPFALAAVHVTTTMTGSALLTAMLVSGRIDREAFWTAAHVDEDWQISQWGEDAEAQERRAKRRVEFDAAYETLTLAHAADAGFNSSSVSSGST